MKKSILVIILFIISLAAKTQIQKGQFMAGGNISYESDHEEYNNPTNSYTSNHLLVAPDFGYFLQNKFAAGLNLNINSYWYHTSGIIKNTTISLSPFLRYYLIPTVKKVNVMVEAGYLNYKHKLVYVTGNSSMERTRGYNILGGLVIFLSKQVGLEFILGYTRTITGEFDARVSKVIHSGMGLQVYLAKKGKQK